MKNIILSLTLFTIVHSTAAQEESRQYVEFPPMMRNHMMSNMRDHLVTINKIQRFLANDEMDKAAEIAENHLGMSSLGMHNAQHMAKFMPKDMAQAGTAMHKASSRFALKAEEGNLLPAYKALAEITSTCVACHAAYYVNKN